MRRALSTVSLLAASSMTGWLLLSASAATGSPPSRETIGIGNHPGARDLHQFAEQQRQKYRWPALGVGIMHNGKIVGLGFAGERKLGSGNWVAADDRFEVGSIAKSITALIAATLVEEGKLRWDARIIDVFPEWQKSILPAYANVTLEQLLGHRSGLDQWMKSNETWTGWQKQHSTKSATEKRELFAIAALQREPQYPPGTQHHYCNDGYLVAGSMIEKASGQTFENLVRQRLFEPLGLKSARFGPGPADEMAAAVWGHEHGPGIFGRTTAIKPDPAEFGEPPFGSPAGFLYCSVPDLLRYVGFHMAGAGGKAPLLKPGSLDRLHAPLAGQQYALGWEVEAKRDSGGKIVERSIYHGGYSGRTRANVWFCPETQWGTVIVCNDGDGDGSEMAAVFTALLKEFQLIGEPAGK